jgi:hypothetical protein
MRTIIIIATLGLLLAGCDTLSAAKGVAAGFVAEKGNSYCELRDNTLKQEALAKVNEAVKEQGALWHFEGGIVCEQ